MMIIRVNTYSDGPCYVGVTHTFHSIDEFFNYKEIKRPEVGTHLEIKFDSYEAMKTLCLRLFKLNRNWKIESISKLFYKVKYVYCHKPTWIYYYTNNLDDFSINFYEEIDQGLEYTRRESIDNIYFSEGYCYDPDFTPVVKFYGKRFEWERGGLHTMESETKKDYYDKLQPLDEDDMNKIEMKFEKKRQRISVKWNKFYNPYLYKNCKFIRNNDGTCEIREITQSEELLLKI